jgi:hypothetical protein
MSSCWRPRSRTQAPRPGNLAVAGTGHFTNDGMRRQRRARPRPREEIPHPQATSLTETPVDNPPLAPSPDFLNSLSHKRPFAADQRVLLSLAAQLTRLIFGRSLPTASRRSCRSPARCGTTISSSRVKPRSLMAYQLVMSASSPSPPSDRSAPSE